MRRARGIFSECAKAGCNVPVAQQCRSGLQQLENDTPSIVPVATDRAGAQLVDVSVSMDGEVLTSKIDGRALDVDPGLHEFVFSTEKGDVYAEKVLVLEGQRNRVISGQLSSPGATSWTVAAAEPAAPPAAEAPPTPPPLVHTEPPASERRDASLAANSADHGPSLLLPYVIGGVGLAAVGSSFLLAHWGREDSILLDRCAPNCSRESADHVSHMYIAADITLGAGVVALGAATWLYLARSGHDDTSSARSYHFDIQPTASGAYATMGRAF